MRLALRTGDSAMLNGLMTATPFTGARGSTADGDLVVAETALAP
jgi:hypothetical protein